MMRISGTTFQSPSPRVQLGLSERLAALPSLTEEASTISEPGVQTLVGQTPRLWRGTQTVPRNTFSTGYPTLDARLPGQGWPVGALTELIPHSEGLGEVQLLLPALRRLTQSHRDVLLINPPYLPYAPALAKARLRLKHLCWINTENDDEAQWVAEQSLHAGAAGAVVLWSSSLADAAMYRLQLAARDGMALSFVCRPIKALDHISVATLRLSLRPGAGGALRVELVNVPGGQLGALTLYHR